MASFFLLLLFLDTTTTATLCVFSFLSCFALPTDMSTFGKVFRVTTFGESHGAGVGCIIDGVPPCMPLAEADIQPQLDRRRPGQGALSTPRNEPDRVIIQSGTENGLTLGSPVGLFVANRDQRPVDYSDMCKVPRPSHADYTYMAKYGIKASSGGGRSSARETLMRVAAGAVAEKWLGLKYGIEIVAWVSSAGDQAIANEPDTALVSRADVDASAVRCPDADSTARMVKAIEDAKRQEDSIGGTVTCVCRNVPAGLGEPCFDKIEAALAHAMLSIPATKGFEIGSGFAGTSMRGSQHNDPFVVKTDADGRRRLGTSTNHSGGVQGGITNGEPIVFRVAFKPPATIGSAQQTCEYGGEQATLEARGRHDPCVVARAVPIVEAMAAMVLADAALLQLARDSSLVGTSPVAAALKI
ncbi:Chorismate synthase [Pandoravirus dulcis]|uniref:chorismate synthase n=1 Tax=Pandoravirus dulcis TaxID=1349409 RepID=A0A291AU41_9VIRU|nr:Chorismate synthase [Pandoravirus dulcis]ATE82457.1 Chorismate synthase [Pandoravirus dulcis]